MFERQGVVVNDLHSSKYWHHLTSLDITVCSDMDFRETVIPRYYIMIYDVLLQTFINYTSFPTLPGASHSLPSRWDGKICAPVGRHPPSRPQKRLDQCECSCHETQLALMSASDVQYKWREVCDCLDLGGKFVVTPSQQGHSNTSRQHGIRNHL